MKLGLMLGYWMQGPEDPLDLVLEAERLGYDSVWTAEAYGSDAATILGWLAHATSQIRLGAAIFQMPARARRVPRRDARAAASGRPGQGVEAHHRAGAVLDPGLSGGDRPEEHDLG